MNLHHPVPASMIDMTWMWYLPWKFATVQVPAQSMCTFLDGMLAFCTGTRGMIRTAVSQQSCGIGIHSITWQMLLHVIHAFPFECFCNRIDGACDYRVMEVVVIPFYDAVWRLEGTQTLLLKVWTSEFPKFKVPKVEFSFACFNSDWSLVSLSCYALIRLILKESLC